MIEPQIADLADKLGQAMADSQAARTFKKARTEALGDKDAQALLKAYQDHMGSLVRKEQARQPIEVADKQKLRELQEKTYGNAKLKTLMESQANYVELIQQVNDLMGKHLMTGEETIAKA